MTVTEHSYTAGKRVRVGIDVGGTFTKAVAIESGSGVILAKTTVPTTHSSERGVSDGILQALFGILDNGSGISMNDIELISHSTTQAINALLERDMHKVGIVAMGVGPTKKEVVKRTRLEGGRGHRGLETCHEFLDTSHLIEEEETESALKRLRGEGAEVIVATEAFGVDDPSNELFVMNSAVKMGLPCTASHEISSIYGLEIRTLTAAVNASIMPKTFKVADFVEGAMRRAGVTAPLMIMKGDGGVTDMETFRSKPILTVLSGPAASVAGALLHLKVTNGIFVEVGGTSTNISVIKNGRPEIKYVVIRDHPTCIRSLDVRILGVAGGSMVTLHKRRVKRVGPRSAHIAGLKYACFADPRMLADGRLVMIKPKPNDEDEYAAIRCGEEGGETFAITNTCAANALDMIPEGDYSWANQESAKIAMKKLGESMGVSYPEAAMSVIQTASFDITKTVAKMIKEYKIKTGSARIIGGGGGASVLVPFVAKQIRVPYEKAEHAEVISSIGVASAMLREEKEISMADPTPEAISVAHKSAKAALVAKGAVPESVSVDSTYMPDKAILRVTATGNVEMEGVRMTADGEQSDAGWAGHAFTPDEAKRRASEVMEVEPDLVTPEFESDHHTVFVGRVTVKRLFGKKSRQHMVVLDRFGRTKIKVDNGRMFRGDGALIAGELGDFLKSRHSDIAPQIYLIDDSGLMDFSGLTSASHVLGAVRDQLGDGRAAVVVEV